MNFSAFQSSGGSWWVQCEWPRNKYRYGGSSLIWCAPDQETAEEVAEAMQTLHSEKE